MTEETFDVIIVGGGPAGLTAALYTARHNHKTLVLEGGKTGGKALLAHWVDNYPGFPEGISGQDLMENMIQHAVRFGAGSSSATTHSSLNNSNRLQQQQGPQYELQHQRIPENPIPGPA